MKTPIKQIGMAGIDAVDESQVELRRSLYQERSQLLKGFGNAAFRLQALGSAYPRDFKELKKTFGKPKLRVVPPADNDLQANYESVVARLDRKQREVTAAEHLAMKELELRTRKQIRPSVWIGSLCLDFFIPNIRSERVDSFSVMRGLAIEIDGDVHNYESKMAKDEAKADQLFLLNIGVTHFKNIDVKSNHFRGLAMGLSALPTLDSRERRRLWRRIYGFTLAIQLNNEEFFELFKPLGKKVPGGKS